MKLDCKEIFKPCILPSFLGILVISECVSLSQLNERNNNYVLNKKERVPYEMERVKRKERVVEYQEWLSMLNELLFQKRTICHPRVI